MHVSPVVSLELESHIRVQFDRARDTAVRKLDDLSAATGVEVAEAQAAVRGQYQALESAALALSRDAWGAPGIGQAAMPDTDVSDLVTRELQGRRPFKESKSGSIGLRDAVIWLGAVEALASNPGDRLLLVTNDLGFLAPDEQDIHADLHRDLLDRGIDRRRVDFARGVADAVNWLRREKGQIEERERQITKLLTRLDSTLKDQRWGSFEGSPGGPGDFREWWADLELPPAIEHVTLEAADFIEVVSIGPGNHAACTHRANLSFTGTMMESDWLALLQYEDMAYAPGEYHVWTAHPHPDYVSIETSRDVYIDSFVAYDEATREARLEYLDSVRLVPRSGQATATVSTIVL